MTHQVYAQENWVVEVGPGVAARWMVSGVGWVSPSSTGCLWVLMLGKGVRAEARWPSQIPNPADCSGVSNFPSGLSVSHVRGS